MTIFLIAPLPFLALTDADTGADVLVGDDVVTAADVAEAARLVRVATQAAATDPRTGGLYIYVYIWGYMGLILMRFICMCVQALSTWT
jgi:hypothetical protein